ncbi:MAG TPA: DUF2264 domain-containing protein [Epulopiscium sp.]|nr:DUF2264 domain-containing protein [Candidatus Epulonipiscium sp.]
MKKNTREIWINYLTQVSSPVLKNMANDSLKSNMPIKQHLDATNREYCIYLEALARTLCGLAPWLNVCGISKDEKSQQKYFLDLSIKAIKNAVNPESKDFVYGRKDGQLLPQILVDTAFLALAFIRAKNSLWDRLGKETQDRVIQYFTETREIQPHYSNWILFSSMIEAFFYKIGEPYDIVRLDYGFKQMDAWYVGDGVYSDGEKYHQDYYNSYVIQPFLVEMLETIKEDYRDRDKHYMNMIKRAKRYAEIQEMAINMDGSFVPYGRSITYRMGAFHHLATMAYLEQLPKSITPGQVRKGLTKVITKCLEAPNTFDQAGWLNIGLYGHQPSLGEVYISTGSLYLCSTVFLPLGLDAQNDFWLEDEETSMDKIWSGTDVGVDCALDDKEKER